MAGWLDHRRDMPNTNKIKRYAENGEKVTCVQAGFGGIDHEIKTSFAQAKPTLVKVQQKFPSAA